MRKKEILHMTQQQKQCFYVKVEISELGNKSSFQAFTQIFPPHQQVALSRVKIDNVLFQENQVGLW